MHGRQQRRATTPTRSQRNATASSNKSNKPAVLLPSRSQQHSTHLKAKLSSSQNNNNHTQHQSHRTHSTLTTPLAHTQTHINNHSNFETINHLNNSNDDNIQLSISSPKQHSLSKSVHSTHRNNTPKNILTAQRRYRYDFEDKKVIKKNIREKGQQRPPMNPFAHHLVRVDFNDLKDKLKVVVVNAKEPPPSAENDHVLSALHKQNASKDNTNTNNKDTKPKRTIIHHSSTINNFKNKKNNDNNDNTSSHLDEILPPTHITPNTNSGFYQVKNMYISTDDVVQIIPEHIFTEYRTSNTSLLAAPTNMKAVAEETRKQLKFHGTPRKLVQKNIWATPINSVFHTKVHYKHKNSPPQWDALPKAQFLFGGKSILYTTHSNDAQKYSFDHIPMIPVDPRGDQHDSDSKIHVLPDIDMPVVKTLPLTASGQFRRNLIEELDRFLIIKQMLRNALHNFRVRLPYYDLSKESNRKRIMEELILWRKMNLRLRDKNYPDLGGISRWWITISIITCIVIMVHRYHYNWVEADLLNKEMWKQKLVERSVISPDIVQKSTNVLKLNGLDQLDNKIKRVDDDVIEEAALKRQVEEDIYYSSLNQLDNITKPSQTSTQTTDTSTTTSKQPHIPHIPGLIENKVDIKHHLRSLELPVLPPSLPNAQAIGLGIQNIPIMADIGDMSTVTLLPTKVVQPEPQKIMSLLLDAKSQPLDMVTTTTNTATNKNIFGTFDSNNSDLSNIQSTLQKTSTRKSVFDTIANASNTNTNTSNDNQHDSDMIKNQPKYSLQTVPIELPTTYTPEKVSNMGDDLTMDEFDQQINALLAQQELELEQIRKQSELNAKRGYSSSSLANRGFIPTNVASGTVDNNNNNNAALSADAALFQNLSPTTTNLHKTTGQIVPATASRPSNMKDTIPASVLNHVMEQTSSATSSSLRHQRYDSGFNSILDSVNNPQTNKMLSNDNNIDTAMIPDHTTTTTITTTIDQDGYSFPNQPKPQSQSYIMQAGDLVWKTAQSTGGAMVAGAALTLIAPLSLPLQLGILGGGYGALGLASTYGYDALAAIGLVGGGSGGNNNAAANEVINSATQSSSPVNIINLDDSHGHGGNNKAKTNQSVQQIDPSNNPLTKLLSPLGDTSQVIVSDSTPKPITDYRQNTHLNSPQEDDPLYEFQQLVEKQRQMNQQQQQQQQQSGSVNVNNNNNAQQQQGYSYINNKVNQSPVAIQKSSPFYPQALSTTPTSIHPSFGKNSHVDINDDIGNNEIDRLSAFSSQLNDIQRQQNPLQFTKSTTSTAMARDQQRNNVMNELQREVENLEVRQKLIRDMRNSPEMNLIMDDLYDGDGDY